MRASLRARLFGAVAAAITAPLLMGAGFPGAAALPARTQLAAPSRILLTPTVDPATSQLVSWTMSARTPGQKVQYRTAGGPRQAVRAARGPATSVKFSGSKRPRYSATLVGLTPGTSYEYRIVTSRAST